MKILQLGKFYPIKGGVEQVMYTLVEGISARNIRCDMLCAALSGKTRRFALNGHADIITTRSWRRVAATMISPDLVRTLAKIAQDYDLIHIHHPDPMAAIALKFSGYKGKVVLHWHSDILKQKKLLELYRPIQEWLIDRADLIVATSPVYPRHSLHLRGSSTPTTVLPIGIPEQSSDSQLVHKLRKEYKGKKIVFALGRLVPYKGFNVLVEAASYLSDEYIVLIGGEGPLKDELEQQIKTLGLENSVKLLGNVSNEMRSALYSAAAVFCLPSVQKTEAFGIVQLEAMASACPVVATEIEGSGVPWVNAHGESGVNVPVNNPRALAEAVVSICGDQSVREQFGERARKRYEKLFRQEDMIENCLKIYETVLSPNYKEQSSK